MNVNLDTVLFPFNLCEGDDDYVAVIFQLPMKHVDNDRLWMTSRPNSKRKNSSQIKP